MIHIPMCVVKSHSAPIGELSTGYAQVIHRNGSKITKLLPKIPQNVPKMSDPYAILIT